MSNAFPNKVIFTEKLMQSACWPYENKTTYNSYERKETAT